MNESDLSLERLRLSLKAKRAEEALRKEAMREKLKGIYLPMSLVREVGLDAAFFYCYVLNRLPEGSERTVSLRIEDVEKETGLNEYYQRKLLKKLSDVGYLGTFINARGYTGVGDEFEGPRRNIEVLKLPSDIVSGLLRL
ncbi:MAG: hypothetical protein ABSG17_06300 [Spirochaetia bacterium]|jgi:hypothetical protein